MILWKIDGNYASYFLVFFKDDHGYGDVHVMVNLRMHFEMNLLTSYCMTDPNPSSGFQSMSVTNWAVQPQKMVRGLKLQIKEIE